MSLYRGVRSFPPYPWSLAGTTCYVIPHIHTHRCTLMHSHPVLHEPPLPLLVLPILGGLTSLHSVVKNAISGAKRPGSNPGSTTH